MKIKITVECDGQKPMSATVTSPFDLDTLIYSYRNPFDPVLGKLSNVMDSNFALACWGILLHLYDKEQEVKTKEEQK